MYLTLPIPILPKNAGIGPICQYLVQPYQILLVPMCAIHTMLTECEMGTEKCSGTCQNLFWHSTKKWSDIHAIMLNFGLDMCKIKVRIVRVNTKSVQMSKLLFHTKKCGLACRVAGSVHVTSDFWQMKIDNIWLWVK